MYWQLISQMTYKNLLNLIKKMILKLIRKVGKGFVKTIYRNGNKMACKYLKTCLTTLITRKMQMKTLSILTFT